MVSTASRLRRQGVSEQRPVSSCGFLKHGPYDCPRPPVRWHHRCVSSRSFRRLMLSGISFAACLRTTSGTRSFPIPWPVKSRTIVTRDPESPGRASTDTFTIARIGPSTPRSAQRLGGSYSVIAVVTSRSRPPIFRTVVHRDPTVVVGVSRRPRTTPCCHSDMVLGSMTYAKTSSGGLATSVLEMMGANWTPSRLSAVYCPPLHGRLGVASRISPCLRTRVRACSSTPLAKIWTPGRRVEWHLSGRDDVRYRVLGWISKD
jgi:hypothetical protein